MLDPAIFEKIFFVVVREMLEFEPAKIIWAVSDDEASALTQAIQSIIVYVEISISPTAFPSILYSSVTADPAPTIDQPFVVESARSFTSSA